ncbi:hypothetical protein PHLCEN_2v13420 [Hermanssonia centrifuga]|uniref:Uncharacterized protein n=1 Tax=Hermanssonia centrifuga TaxID=98765 RepID=A0A2R6NE89_9APHY|nr:hypothetical protein PHLCEN_2v13420 [Hermanssonia centrifuga]
MNSRALRRPSQAYKNKNGFAPSEYYHDPSNVESALDALRLQKTPKQLRDEVEAHFSAEQVLEVRGSYFSLASMEAALDASDTAPSVNQRVTEMRTKHYDESEVLQDLLAEQYRSDVLDAYFDKDDTFEVPELETYFQSLCQPEAPVLAPLPATLSELHYAHLRTATRLVRRSEELAAKEDAARKVRDSYFPSGIAEYRAIRHKDIQVRIARFLLADKQAKERMLSEFGWAWRQVKALEDAYADNVSDPITRGEPC